LQLLVLESHQFFLLVNCYSESRPFLPTTAISERSFVPSVTTDVIRTRFEEPDRLSKASG
jgi:hypothetical protein